MPTTASIRINGGTAGLAETDLPLNGTVYLSNDTAASTYEWVIVSQPAGAQDGLTNPDPFNPIVSYAPAPEFTPTKEGSYLIRLTVNKLLADEATDTTICAVRELLTGDRIPAPQETTEVNEEYGWATAAVTKILQRVTRLSDAGIFVAQNASAGNLDLGQVVHMNGMATIGNGDNERPILTVGLALASDLAKVDGPLGVVVGNRDGETNTIANGDLCRVMVMGGIPSYDLGSTAAEGSPVYVDNFGSLSLTAGDVVRQVGDVAKDYGSTVFDIAISAGSNSIPRGSAGGDLTGAYPDPTVGKLRGVDLSTNMESPIDYNVIRYDQGTLSWVSAKVFLGLPGGDVNGSVIGSLKTENGGTGAQLTTVAQGGVVYADSTTSMAVSGVGTSGYLLKSNGTAAPSWIQTVPPESGGTGIAGGYTVGAMLYANGANLLTSLAPTPAATRGILQSKGVGAAPVWISNGTSGYPLISKGSGTDATFEQLNLVTAVTGTLPVSNGGTGQASALIPGGLIVAQSTTAMTSLTTPVTSGSVLLGGPGAGPSWSAKLPLASGGTNADLSGVSGLYGVVVKASSTTIGVTASGVTGDILVATTLALPTWQNFATFFDAQYAGSTVSTDATFSTTGGAFSEIVATTRSCKRGMVQVTPMPITDGAAFINHITTATINTYSTVSLKYVVTFPDATVENYNYQFRSPVSHGNNQVNGSITFPSLTFYTSQEGNHTVSLQATISPSGDTFTVNAIALRISQG